MLKPPIPSATDFQQPGMHGRVRPFLSMWKKIFPLLLLFPAFFHVHADVKKKGDDKKKKESYAPEVRDASAGFVAGQSVDIELTASEGSLKQVEFIIRQAPQNGTLSAVRPHPRDTNKGIVTYTHRDRDAPLTDRFTFAARVDGGPMSAPSTVTLTGRGFEPRLEVLEVAAADRVFPGGESTIKFTLKNSGDAPFARDMTWEAPWRGPPRLELKAGEKADYIVVFKPAKNGIFRSTVEIQPGKESSKLQLYGECVRAITVSPGRLMLAQNEKTGTREGILTLVNGRADTMHVEISAPQRLEGAGVFDVPGAGKTIVTLRLPVTDVAAFRGEITVSTQEGAETIPAEAEAKGQELRVTAPAKGILEIGAVEQGTIARGEIQLSNSGGMPSLVEAQAFPPLIVTPAHQALRVEPGAKVTFAVSLKADQTGPFQSEVRLIGAGSMIRVPVSVLVLPQKSPQAQTTPGQTTPARPPDSATASPTTATPETSSDADTPFQQMIMGYFRTHGVPMPMNKINPYLERVKDPRIIDRTATSITLSWKKPDTMPARWEVEAAKVDYVPGTKNFLKQWKTFKTWEPVSSEADKVGIRLHSLPEASQIEIRIMAVDRDGKFSEPSPPLLLKTMPPWKISPWFWYVLLVVVLTTALYYLIRIRRGDFAK